MYVLRVRVYNNTRPLYITTGKLHKIILKYLQFRRTFLGTYIFTKDHLQDRSP